MDKKLNTKITFEFFDGSTTEMTLFFYALNQLKNERKDLYRRYCEAMNAMNKRQYDELEIITILYVAHVCANLENPMKEEEFMFLCGCDRAAMSRAFRDLTSPKKHKPSEQHLKAELKPESTT